MEYINGGWQEKGQVCDRAVKKSGLDHNLQRYQHHIQILKIQGITCVFLTRQPD